ARPAIWLAKNDETSPADGLAVGRFGTLTEHLKRAVRSETIGPLGLDVLKEQRAVGAPERPLGEFKPAGQALDRPVLEKRACPCIPEKSRHGLRLQSCGSRPSRLLAPGAASRAPARFPAPSHGIISRLWCF